MARARKLAHHHLGINEILGAAETNETYFCHELNLDEYTRSEYQLSVGSCRTPGKPAKVGTLNTCYF